MSDDLPPEIEVIHPPGGSFYNWVLGDGHNSERGALLVAGILGISSVGRFRDAWVEKGEHGLVIAVYTRNGDGNREHIEEHDDEVAAGPSCTCTGCIATYTLPSHPNYLRDADDEFDSTYATFYFSVPEEYRTALEGLAVEPVNMSQRWRDAIDAITGI